MDFATLLSEDVRLALLQFLSEGSYSQNESVLRDLLKRTGRMLPADKLRTELAWLREQGLIFVEDVYDTWVASISVRGLDVANGVALVPGVRRPNPRKPGSSSDWLEH
jgi:hypothetical protein